MSQDVCKTEIETETEEEKEFRLKREAELQVIREGTLKEEEEIRLIAEWFFRKKVTNVGEGYVEFVDGTKTSFMLDADNNLMDALESKMVEAAEIDHIAISFSRTDVENRVRYTYYKLVTSIGTSYMMSATGRDNRAARKKALLKYLGRNTKL